MDKICVPLGRLKAVVYEDAEYFNCLDCKVNDPTICGKKCICSLLEIQQKELCPRCNLVPVKATAI